MVGESDSGQSRRDDATGRMDEWTAGGGGSRTKVVDGGCKCRRI